MFVIDPPRPTVLPWGGSGFPIPLNGSRWIAQSAWWSDEPSSGRRTTRARSR